MFLLNTSCRRHLPSLTSIFTMLSLRESARTSAVDTALVFQRPTMATSGGRRHLVYINILLKLRPARLQPPHQPLNTIQVSQKPRIPCVKSAHPSETFRVGPVEEVLCYIRPPIHDQARKPRVGVIEPVEHRVRLFHNRNASEVNTFVEPVRIHPASART